MKRREFVAVMGCAVLAPPFAALAQRVPMPVIGFLGAADAAGYAKTIDLIRGGLADAGFVEGKNVTFEFRWAEGEFDRLPGLAAELVQRDVAVIVTTGGPVPVRAAKAATSTIPIVFATGSDPLQGGLVPNLNGWAGNVTGVTFLNTGLMPKRVEVLHEALPGASLFAVLVNGRNPGVEADKREISRAAAASGVKIVFVEAADLGGPDRALAEVVESKADAVLVHHDSVLYGRIREIIALAARHRIPAIYFIRECAELGGLISYGPNPDEVLRQAGLYAGRILKGEKAGNLPVQQPTKFELVINLKTAKALGLTIPPSLLARADEMIE
jgi:ABC-type uncharacterized transport system substrate-binding protein